MSDWRVATLGDLGRIVTGKTPPSTEMGCFGGTVPFITPTDMDGRRIIDRSLRSLTEKGVNLLTSCYLPDQAVLMSCIGSDMGKAALTAQDSVTNQQINAILVSHPNDRKFVYYNLSARRAEIRNLASGAAQPIMNKSFFSALPIHLPSLLEQNRISSVLSSLDDKIELNRRMNETLEAMTRAIFKDWFVDFGPVRAKAEGRPPYLAPELWSLFPDKMDDEKKPEGWERIRLDQLADHCKGSISPTDEPFRTFELYSLPAFDNGQEPAANLGNQIMSNKTVIPEGTVLLYSVHVRTRK